MISHIEVGQIYRNPVQSYTDTYSGEYYFFVTKKDGITAWCNTVFITKSGEVRTYYDVLWDLRNVISIINPITDPKVFNMVKMMLI